MDKTSEKVTKDPKRQERGKKSQETYLKRLKKEILEELSTSAGDPMLPTSSPTGNSTPSTSYSTGNSTPSTLSHTTKSNDTYVYGVGILAILAIGVCVFFAYNTFQPKNKK